MTNPRNADQDVKLWAEGEAQHQTRLAHDAGMTAARWYHEGVAAQLGCFAGDVKAGVRLGELVTRDGQMGVRALRGSRAALAMVEGVRSLLDHQALQNAAAWTEGTPADA